MRVLELQAHGVTTLESKSGFGLDLETELRQMRLSRELARALPVTVVSTFLGAHGIGPEYAGRPGEYIDFLKKELTRIIRDFQLDWLKWDNSGIPGSPASGLSSR